MVCNSATTFPPTNAREKSPVKTFVVDAFNVDVAVVVVVVVDTAEGSDVDGGDDEVDGGEDGGELHAWSGWAGEGGGVKQFDFGLFCR